MKRNWGTSFNREVSKLEAERGRLPGTNTVIKCEGIQQTSSIVGNQPKKQVINGERVLLEVVLESYFTHHSQPKTAMDAARLDNT